MRGATQAHFAQADLIPQLRKQSFYFATSPTRYGKVSGIPKLTVDSRSNSYQLTRI